MYHDIRNHKDSDFGRLFHKRYELKSYITRNKFIKQIDFIKNESDIISTSQFLELDKNDKGNYSILTFDDGLLDHYDILDILIDKKINGTFFIPCEAVTRRKILLSNKIQFILALVDEKKLTSLIIDELGDDKLWDIYSVSKWKDNWWSPEMVFVTNILRNHSSGKRLANQLFKDYVTTDEKDLCDKFYLNTDHIVELVNNGMYIGGHGYISEDLSNMSDARLDNEIFKSIEFVNNFYNGYRTFAYPNGGYNNDTLKCMSKYEYDLAFTTKQETLDSISFDPLMIPRYDASQTRLLP
tara:strand:- start:37020 stop:37910 length:891 start_codon:yes stop_codon:yes gene_type:complete